MPSASRPQYYPFHDLQLANSIPVQQSLYTFNGYLPQTPVPSGDHNGKFNSLGSWAAYTDCFTLKSEDWLNTVNDYALTTDSLTYSVGQSVILGGAPVVTRATYLFEGRRIETDDALLNPIAAVFEGTGSPMLIVNATRPGRLWVYTSIQGLARIQSVGPAVDDTPAANERTLVGVQLDGAGVITANLAPINGVLPSYQIQVVIPILFDDATFADVTLDNLTVTDNTTLGDNVADTLTVNATSTFAQAITVNATATINGQLDATQDFNMGLSPANTGKLNANVDIGDSALYSHSINGDVSIGFDATNTVTVPALINSDLVADSGLLKTAFGILEFLSGAPAPAARQVTAATPDGQLAYDPGTGPEFFHYGDTDFAYGTGDQEAITALLVTQDVAQTSETVQVRAGNASIRVIVSGYFQVSVLGSTVTFDVQEDFSANPVFTNIGTAQVVTALKDIADVNDWQFFRHERIYNPGPNNPTSYRLSSTAQGGASHQLKEVRLRVVNERN